jgi:hypothetical protein
MVALVFLLFVNHEVIHPECLRQGRHVFAFEFRPFALIFSRRQSHFALAV